MGYGEVVVISFTFDVCSDEISKDGDVDKCSVTLLNSVEDDSYPVEVVE